MPPKAAKAPAGKAGRDLSRVSTALFETKSPLDKGELTKEVGFDGDGRLYGVHVCGALKEHHVDECNGRRVGKVDRRRRLKRDLLFRGKSWLRSR